jgi:hypothetical protein
MMKDEKKSSGWQVVMRLIGLVIVLIGVVIYVRAGWFGFVLSPAEVTMIVGAVIAFVGYECFMEAS